MTLSQYRDQPYGNLVELNTERLILDSVGEALLSEIVDGYLDMLGTSATVYEKNGDYATGFYSSGWCRLMIAASRNLCGTDDNREALTCGKWHCHESCWRLSKASMEKDQCTDVECLGGIHIFAIPIKTSEKIIGSINFGYGNPPKDSESLQVLAERFGCGVEELREQSAAYRERSPQMIDFAKSQIQTVARLIGTLVELKQIERKNETLHRGVLSSMVDPMISIDSQGFIHSVSDSVEHVFGWTPDEIIGKNISMLMPAPHRSQHDTYLANYMDSGQTNILGQTREFEALRKDGSLFPCDLTVSRTDFFDHSEILFTGIIRDITERKELEEAQRKLEAKVQQAQKLESLGVLAGGIAHDFNNLLMGVLGNARIVLQDLSSASPVRQGVQQIETAAIRAAELTRQMLAYSGRGRFVVQRIDLSELVEEIGHLLEVSIAKNVVIRYNLASNLPAIEVDVTQVRQVVMNLITNASDAIGDKSGVVTITTGAMDADIAYLSETFLDDDLTEGAYVYLEVSDTGCGMDEATKSKLFDPFFTTKATGRGLGLAATLGIIRGHRGAIKVYSEPGHGTTFKVMFLAVDAPPNEVSENYAATVQSLVGATILVVDDDETVRTLAKRILERSECKVILANDGLQAIDVFRQQADEIDVVLLDMTMPHLSGEKTFRELRRIRADVSVVLSSGYNEQDAIAKFAGKGLAGFMQKPYGPVELVSVIGQALSQSRSTTQTDPVAERTAPEEIARRGDETILVVDDEEVVRKTVRSGLEMNGYTVLEAKDGTEALELYRNNAEEIALVIIDRQMQPMSGEEMLSQLKTIAPEVKAVFFSGYERTVKLSGSALGEAAAILPKPYTSKEFWRVMRHILGEEVK